MAKEKNTTESVKEIQSQEQTTKEIENTEELEKSIQAYGETKKQILEIENGYNEKIGDLETEKNEKLQPYIEQLEILKNSIQDYCNKRREIFFADKQNWKLNSGVLSYRKGFVSVDCKDDKSAIAKILKKNNLEDFATKTESKFKKNFLRMKLELDKKSILGDTEKAYKITGLKTKQGEETFSIEPN